MIGLLKLVTQAKSQKVKKIKSEKNEKMKKMKKYINLGDYGLALKTVTYISYK